MPSPMSVLWWPITVQKRYRDAEQNADDPSERGLGQGSRSTPRSSTILPTSRSTATRCATYSPILQPTPCPAAVIRGEVDVIVGVPHRHPARPTRIAGSGE